MINISMQQLINLWVELEDAYNGVNGFGSTVAEVYAYTLQPHYPGYDANNLTMDSLEYETKASTSLYEVLTLFQSKRDCIISIEEDVGKYRKLDTWLKKSRFAHRVHIEIKRRKKKKT